MTTWVSWYQKGKMSLDLNEARDDGVLGWQWHHLDDMQTICTSFQTDNHSNTSWARPTGTEPPDQQDWQRENNWTTCWRVLSKAYWDLK